MRESQPEIRVELVNMREPQPEIRVELPFPLVLFYEIEKYLPFAAYGILASTSAALYK